MNVFTSHRRRHFVRQFFACLSLAALISNSLLTASAQTAVRKAAQAGSSGEEQRIVHVLNRLGFGARPGDVERVRRMGLENYIEQQLNPSKLSDAVVEAKLKNLPTLALSNTELLAKYPNPGQLLRRLQRRGELPPDLAELVKQRQQGQSPQNRAANPSGDAPRMMQGGETMNAPSAAKPDGDDPAMPADDNPERAKYRRVIAQYMREQGLEPPQRIMQELQASRILRAVYSERQLQEVMVDFWSNHFNVFAQKGADRWFLTSFDRDVIRPHALGNFRTLLEETAKSPAMLFYLDNFQSVSPNAGGRGGLRRMLGGEDGGRMNARQQQRRERRREMRGRADAGALSKDGEQQMMKDGEQPQQTARQPRPQRPRRGINENYARELMELHTLGVEGGYTQKDVQEVARAFTGWTILDPRGYAGTNRGGTFVFNQRAHDDGEKIVLGQKIPSGGGVRDGQLVLDILVRHPSTAKFVATKLARRFVSDNPSPALVARVAAAFTKNNGDISETLRALFGSPEFNSAEARRAKIKTPFELAVSAVRTLGAETDARPALHQWIARMGEPLYQYQAPTGYPDTAEHWVNTGALLERLNFALALVSNRIPGTRVDLARFVGDDATSSRAVNQERIVDQFLGLVLQGDISPKSRAVLMRQLSDQSNAPIASKAQDETSMRQEEMTPGRNQTAAGQNPRAARRARREETAATVGNPEVTRIAALVIGSPEFQRQ